MWDEILNAIAATHISDILPGILSRISAFRLSSMASGVSSLLNLAQRNLTISVENVNAKGTIYSIWIILHKCEGCCEAHLARRIGGRADLVGVLVLNYSKPSGR